MGIDPLAHKATALATLALILKFYGTLLIQGGARFRAGSRPPEDGTKLPTVVKALKVTGIKQSFGVYSDAATDEKLTQAKLNDIRWQRIVLNDLENIPLGLIVAWSSSISCYSPLLHALLVSVFAGARISHTFFYAKEMQPHRGLAWGTGVGATIIMSLNGVLGLFVN
ncbi:UNVERIFIED_CONTAM: hypothetical protein HDU68_011984 [Siphonaria sp. JEL0065]|nr:hypothetical protein HDU68_011984 [Siphonaria sp. JEL0065]